MKLSIVIPAYNEQERLPAMLEAYTAYFTTKYGAEVEFIVVVNGSTDRTERVARGFEENSPRVKVLVDSNPIGKGGAVMMGAREACGDWIGFVDADGATSPEAFDDLMNYSAKADVVIASRYLKGSVVSPTQPLARRVASRCFNLCVRILFGLRLHDTQCGAKIFKRDVMHQVADNLGTTNWAFDVDMLYLVRRQGGVLLEVPTVWSHQGGSRLQVGKASLDMLVALIRLRLYYSPFKFLIPVLSRIVSLAIPFKR